MTATAESIPPVLLNVVRRFRTLHRTVLLTTVTTEEMPHVSGERAEIEPIADGLYRVVLRYGFMDEPHVHEAIAEILAKLVARRRSGHAHLCAWTGADRPWRAGGDGAFVAERLFAVLSRNAANPTDFFELPPEQVVEVGARFDL